MSCERGQDGKLRRSPLRVNQAFGASGRSTFSSTKEWSCEFVGQTSYSGEISGEGMDFVAMFDLGLVPPCASQAASRGRAIVNATPHPAFRPSPSAICRNLSAFSNG